MGSRVGLMSTCPDVLRNSRNTYGNPRTPSIEISIYRNKNVYWRLFWSTETSKFY